MGEGGRKAWCPCPFARAHTRIRPSTHSSIQAITSRHISYFQLTNMMLPRLFLQAESNQDAMTVREIYKLYEHKRDEEARKGSPFNDDVGAGVMLVCYLWCLNLSPLVASHLLPAGPDGVGSEARIVEDRSRFRERHEAL